jgi:hypothetical protein
VSINDFFYKQSYKLSFFLLYVVDEIICYKKYFTNYFMNYFFNLFLKQYLLNLLLKKVFNTSLKTNIFNLFLIFFKNIFYNFKMPNNQFLVIICQGGLTNAKEGKLGGPKLPNSNLGGQNRTIVKLGGTKTAFKPSFSRDRHVIVNFGCI